MSKRSEEAALKAYPKEDGKVWTSPLGMIEFDRNGELRKGYQEGYEEGFRAAKEYMLKFAESHFTKLKPEDEEIGSACYLKGVLDATDYHELTWEDIRLICEIDEDMRCHSDWPLRGQEVYYEEVLRRFREMKYK